MHFLNLPILFVFSRLVLAAPTDCPISAWGLPAWGMPGGFYACTDTGFTGGCGWYPPSDTCWNFPGSPSPRSIKPDVGGYCYIYDDADCTIQSSSVTIDGEQRKLKIECPGSGNIEHPTSSYMKCFKDS